MGVRIGGSGRKENVMKGMMRFEIDKVANNCKQGSISSIKQRQNRGRRLRKAFACFDGSSVRR